MKHKFKQEYVSIIPYMEDDGIRTMKDSFIMSLLDRSEKDGTLDALFYGYKNYKKESLVEKIKSQFNNFFFAVYVGRDIAGFGLIDNIQWGHGYMHFCVFKEFWGESVDPSVKVYELLGKRFSVLIGILPEDNIFAIGFAEKVAEKIGATRMGVIPKYFHNEKEDKRVGGVMYYIERKV